MVYICKRNLRFIEAFIHIMPFTVSACKTAHITMNYRAAVVQSVMIDTIVIRFIFHNSTSTLNITILLLCSPPYSPESRPPAPKKLHSIPTIRLKVTVRSSSVPSTRHSYITRKQVFEVEGLRLPHPPGRSGSCALEIPRFFQKSGEEPC